MNKVHKIILIGILLLATLLRTADLDNIPPHLGNDEISIAYDAYSISQTYRDEHNHFLPLSFQSHNTYKAPLTIYLVAGTTKLFGNNEYSVRLPSAILGVLTILFLGLLVFKLTQNASLALIGSFILTLTPWHIYTSRIIYEANIALFFVVLGVFSFYKWLDSDKVLWISLSFISFALSMYSYHTEWIFTPLLIGVILILHRAQIKQSKGYWAMFILFFILVSPLGFDYINNLGTNARANTELIYRDPLLNRVFTSNEFTFLQKSALFLKAYLGNYSNYTNIGSLFFNGSSIPSGDIRFRMGLFLWILMPAFFVGLVNLKEYFKENTRFIILWLLISPLIPALTTGGPNIIRNLVSVVPYSIVLSVGCLIIWRYTQSKFILLGYLGLLTSSVFYLFQFYYTLYPFYAAEGFQYGYKQIAQYINEHPQEYSQIIIDPKFGDGHNFDGLPHLYIPYYTKLDPQTFLDQRVTTLSGMNFDKYQIRKIEWNQESIQDGKLYIVPNSNSPKGIELTNLMLVKDITLPNGHSAFKLYRYKQ